MEYTIHSPFAHTRDLFREREASLPSNRTSIHSEYRQRGRLRFSLLFKKRYIAWQILTRSSSPGLSEVITAKPILSPVSLASASLLQPYERRQQFKCFQIQQIAFLVSYALRLDKYFQYRSNSLHPAHATQALYSSWEQQSL